MYLNVKSYIFHLEHQFCCLGLPQLHPWL